VRRASLASLPCPIARSLDVVGEWWTLLIVRDALTGARRFDQFKATGIADNILSARLKRLCQEGVLEKRLYELHPPRYEYLLTTKGHALAPVIAALFMWGKRWTSGPSLMPRLVHADCGHEIAVGLTCPHCDQQLDPADVSRTIL
jgi:DNA-binding HxlR family transcriptional regulator